jgi:hypothetical protein
VAPRPPKKPKPKQKRESSEQEAPRAHPASAYPKPLDGETRAAYGALCRYLDAGPSRSLRSVFPKNTHAWCWSSTHRWVERAAAFDDARREERHASLAERQRETDLATAEADARLSAAATAALFSDDEPATPGMGLVRDLWRIGRAGADSARVTAIQTLARLAGIDDLRKLRHHRATAPPPPPSVSPLLTPDVIAALDAHASGAQLDTLTGSPLVDDPPEEPADAADG